MSEPDLIQFYESSVEIEDCTFDSNNFASSEGIVVSGGSLSLTNSNFTANDGTSMLISSRLQLSVNVENCSFSHNKMERPILDLFYLNATITNCEFSRNHMGSSGQFGIIEAENCEIFMSHITGTFNFGNWGTMLHALNSYSTIYDSQFTANKALFGGTFYLNKGNTTISRCEVIRYGLLYISSNFWSFSFIEVQVM